MKSVLCPLRINCSDQSCVVILMANEVVESLPACQKGAGKDRQEIIRLDLNVKSPFKSGDNLIQKNLTGFKWINFISSVYIIKDITGSPSEKSTI